MLILADLVDFIFISLPHYKRMENVDYSLSLLSDMKDTSDLDICLIIQFILLWLIILSSGQGSSLIICVGILTGYMETLYKMLTQLSGTCLEENDAFWNWNFTTSPSPMLLNQA